MNDKNDNSQLGMLKRLLSSVPKKGIIFGVMFGVVIAVLVGILTGGSGLGICTGLACGVGGVFGWSVINMSK